MDRIMSIFSLQDVVDTLTAEGIDAAKHLHELRKYLVHTPSPGRQPAAV